MEYRVFLWRFLQSRTSFMLMLSFFLFFSQLTKRVGLVKQCSPTIADLLRHALAKMDPATREQDLRGDDSLCVIA
jgi:hypothetical protein